MARRCTHCDRDDRLCAPGEIYCDFCKPIILRAAELEAHELDPDSMEDEDQPYFWNRGT